MNKYYVKAWFLNKSSNNMFKLSNKAYTYEVDKLLYDNVCREVLSRHKDSLRFVDSWILVNNSGYKYSNPAVIIPIISDFGHLAMIENDISIKGINSRSFDGGVGCDNIINFDSSTLKEAIYDFVRDYTLKEKCEKNQPLSSHLDLGTVKTSTMSCVVDKDDIKGGIGKPISIKTGSINPNRNSVSINWDGITIDNISPIYTHDDSGNWYINTNSTECDTSGLKINTTSVVDRFDELNDRVKVLENKVDNKMDKSELTATELCRVICDENNLTGKIVFKNGEEIKVAFENNNNNTRKEKNTMNIMKNFDFGPASSAVYKMSPYGLAVLNNDGFVALNKETNDIIDVTGMTFDIPGMIYKMPVAIKDVKAGDVIIHNDAPMYVTINDGNDIVAIDFVAHERKVIIPTKSPFGFNFVTKVMCLAESMFGNMATPDESNPFGGMMLPMMLMNSDGKDNKDMFKTMMLMNMMNGGNGATMDMSNPMTMMCFMNMMD